MLRNFTFVVISLFLYENSFAQHSEASAKDTRTIFNEQIRQSDSLQGVLHNYGTFEGHIRSVFMNTVNQGSNPDYFAIASGGGLAYYSPIIKNFQVGMSGFIIYNLASSDLGKKNGLINRYELGLFDITNPENHGDLDRLENLYLRYYLNSHRKSFLQVGKFHMSTPLMNLQDGRMRPNLQEGAWLEIKDHEKIKLKGGWIWSISPRSTIRWYGVGESIGIYPSGRATNGTPATYSGTVKSKNVFIGNVAWQPFENVRYEYWDYYVDHLFNISLQKVEIKKNSGNNTWLAGFQHLWEKSISEATIAPETQYINPDEQSHVFSGRIALTNNTSKKEWSANYTRITSHGRFLFPREWGSETFYTFNNRERNEGAGDVHAVMLEHIRYLDKEHHLSVRTLAGVYKMPVVNDARLNKYAMPSYYQFNLQARYKFKGFLHGLQTQMLYTYKGSLDRQPESQPQLVHNKTDMHHFSIVMDYYF